MLSSKKARPIKGKGISATKPSFMGCVMTVGSNREEVLRRRTGPGPPETCSSGIVVLRAERSAISQGSAGSGSIVNADIQGRSSREVRGPQIVLIQQSARAQWRLRAERVRLRETPLRLLVGLHGGLDNCGDMRKAQGDARVVSVPYGGQHPRASGTTAKSGSS